MASTSAICAGEKVDGWEEPEAEQQEEAAPPAEQADEESADSEPRKVLKRNGLLKKLLQRTAPRLSRRSSAILDSLEVGDFLIELAGCTRLTCLPIFTAPSPPLELHASSRPVSRLGPPGHRH